MLERKKNIERERVGLEPLLVINLFIVTTPASHITEQNQQICCKFASTKVNVNLFSI